MPTQSSVCSLEKQRLRIGTGRASLQILCKDRGCSTVFWKEMYLLASGRTKRGQVMP